MSENKDQMSFLDHLEELRWHIVRSLIAIIVLAVVAFIFSQYIFNYVILAPNTPEFITNRWFALLAEKTNTPALAINNTSFEIINITMAGQFTTHIKVSLVVGLVLSFPYIFYEFWKFISPALYEEERKYSGGALIFTSILFFLGVMFGYFLIVPLSVDFLGHYIVSNLVVNQISLGSYIGTVTSISLASGVIFELPIIIYFLSKVGLVNPKGLKTYRRHAVVAIVFVSAIITPPDIYSQILVSLPLLVLYEAGIVISRRVEKKKQKEEQEEDENKPRKKAYFEE